MNYLIIKVRDHWNFEFDADDRVHLVENNLMCSYCHHTWLDSTYSYIITRLDRAGLLPDDYEPVCCYCYTLLRFGLIGLKEELVGFIYDKDEDILIILFTSTEAKKDLVEFGETTVRIHEYSKWA